MKYLGLWCPKIKPDRHKNRVTSIADRARMRRSSLVGRTQASVADLLAMSQELDISKKEKKPYKKYRKQLLLHLKRLHNPECPLTYLDTTEIKIPEILESWPNTGFSNERALFTFRVIRRRALEGKDPTQLRSFDISGNSLENIDVSEFRNLKSLNLSSNSLSAEAFKTCGVFKLRHLTTLNIKRNKIDSIKEFVKGLDKIKSLKISIAFLIHVSLNQKKGEEKDQGTYIEENVRLLFGMFKKSAHVDFKLKSIDDIPYNLEQRYAAMEAMMA